MSTFATIAELLVNRIGTNISDVKLESVIGSDLGLRDGAEGDFIRAVEDRFEISIHGFQWRRLNTLSDLVDLIRDLVHARNAERAPC